jgi:hypothetical protein
MEEIMNTLPSDAGHESLPTPAPRLDRADVAARRVPPREPAAAAPAPVATFRLRLLPSALGMP